MEEELCAGCDFLSLDDELSIEDSELAGKELELSSTGLGLFFK
jgi:hypothetical protein